jgi:hypothetical protein
MTDENLEPAKDTRHNAMSADSAANPLAQRYAPELLGQQSSYPPIGFSTPADPNIQLVDVAQMHRLEELHDDSAFMQTVCLAIVGLTVGILIGDSMQRHGADGQIRNEDSLMSRKMSPSFFNCLLSLDLVELCSIILEVI